MKVRATIMNDQTPILLLNWVILPPKLVCTLAEGHSEEATYILVERKT